MAETPHQLDPQLRDRVKTILRRDLKLGPDVPIEEDMPLIGGDFELDSLDIVLLVTSVEKEFGIKIANEAIGKDAFSSVGSLVQFLQERIESQPDAHAAKSNNGSNGSSASHGSNGQHTAGAHPAPPAAAGPTNGSLPRPGALRAGATDPAPATTPGNMNHLLAALPHQPPFRFISRLGELAPQVHGEAEWDLTGQEDFFAGHFPDRPIVPGVLVSEALAQLSGLVGVDPHATGPQRAELAHVNVRFRRAAEPPTTLTLRSRMLQDMEGLQRFEVEALLGDDVIADGEITLKRTP